MRNVRTDDEAKAVNALSEFLERSGYEDPIELEGWVDNPDVIFKTNQGRVACEIASVVPDDIIKWYFKKLPDLPVGWSREIVIPREPHEWATKIIAKKEKKIGQYRSRSKSSKIWLLIHASEKISKILSPAASEDIELLRYAAHTESHRFKKILFFDGAGKIVELYDHKNRKSISIDYRFLESGYPTYVTRTVLMGPIAGLAKDTYSKIEIDVNRLLLGDRIYLDPFDDKYKKYEPIIAMPEEKPYFIIGDKDTSTGVTDPSVVFPEYFASLKK